MHDSLPLRFEVDEGAEPVRTEQLDDAVADLLLAVCEAEDRDRLAWVVEQWPLWRDKLLAVKNPWLDKPAIRATADAALELLQRGLDEWDKRSGRPGPLPGTRTTAASAVGA